MSDSPSALLTDAEVYLAPFGRRNHFLYMVIVFVSMGGSPFGDMTVFVPTLAMRLNAPTWIVTLPTIVDYSIAFLPPLLLGWLMGPRTSRTAVYSWSVALMYVPILVLAIFLFAAPSVVVLRIVFCASVIFYALAMGVSILPSWDLFARIFSDSRRPRIIGQAGAVGQGATLVTAGLAGWLISTHSPLAFPKNYAVSMLIFASNGFVCAFVIRKLKEYTPPATGERRSSFANYLRDLWRILRTDRPFVSTLRLAMLAITLASVTPIVLTYAVQHRGFSGQDEKAILVTLRPYVLIPVALLLGYIAHRIGPARVTGGLGVLVALAIPLSIIFSGRLQLIPLLMVAAGSNTTFYALLSAMRCARPNQMHQYLALYFTICMIPGLAPLGYAWLLDRRPELAMSVIMIVALVVAVGFLLLDRKIATFEPSAAVAS